ncbi:tetratricopeptide repeat protein [Pseudofulvimonas gallinarii]|uniref:Putative CXXCH cytochrome family protein n=1 Tax=Pseudofulvimonas gallinarii TaxID=634155 RepID=A0A4S3KUP7_9GAMM|nr:tetratricopeptide repeat protein [Pseudofulvimonas gallinarii]TCS95230.1 putative CXXCH cytochrome family protein [Pseudofulvimonas gallinarii]THD12932.1 hypothetical protein B1808_10495 [Pseudofulvimonas gallinarii]
MFHDVALIRGTLRTVLPAAFALLVAACSAPETAQVQAVGGGGVSQAFLPLSGSDGHVGAKVCGQCHRQALEDWQGSHHDLAMQPATPQSVLGDFEGATFDYAGTTTEFRRRGRRFFVFTDGPDGEPAEFEILYTFGHRPLQQYLIELPGGRLQAFGIAWDSRDAEAGGQRWFHLYPDQRLTAGHRLHWTGPDQNWNFMCAECHSTGLKKNYDADSDGYDTQWTEIDVACEACHGPGLAHAQWAVGGQPADTPDKALAVTFHERAGVEWTRLEGSAFAVRSQPRTTRIEIDACGRCHGRASRLLGDEVHGAGLLASHRPALLDPDQYWPDGQMLGEVFNWGPFLQSRMQQAGVTCSDCHQPHSLALRAEGNALCAQCHDGQRFDQPAHTHHAGDGEGSRCVACHMPTTSFMGVDDRHDHAFRIPRPDLSAALGGAPDACTGCHQDRSPDWAAQALREWFPDSRHRGAHSGEVLQAAHRGEPGTGTRLAQLVADPSQPAIVRASALRAFGPWLDGDSLVVATPLLAESDPLLRLAATELLSQLPPPQRAAHLAPMLDDPVLAVRLEAADALAGVAEAWLSPAARRLLELAVAELEASLAFNADRADTLVSLGDLRRRQGDPGEAERAYRRALQKDGDSLAATLQLADLAREQGREAEADDVLRRALRIRPGSAELNHALGLSLVRQRRGEEALQRLQRAAELAPGQARYAYVLAVARHDLGDAAAARDGLREALRRHPDNVELLHALATYELEAGHRDEARALARRLVSIDPENPSGRELLNWLDRR